MPKKFYRTLIHRYKPRQLLHDIRNTKGQSEPGNDGLSP